MFQVYCGPGDVDVIDRGFSNRSVDHGGPDPLATFAPRHCTTRSRAKDHVDTGPIEPSHKLDCGASAMVALLKHL